MAPVNQLRQQQQSTKQFPTRRRRSSARSRSSLSGTAPRVRLRDEPWATGSTPQPQLDTRSFDPLPSTKTTFEPETPLALARRARVSLPSIPTSYYQLNAGPAPGTIVGIVLGAVLGFALLFWIIVAIIGNRANAQFVEGDETEIVVRREGHSSRRSRHTQHTRTQRTHRSRTSRSSSSDHNPPPQPRRESPKRQRSERIIVQETRRTESRAPPPAPPSVSQVHSPRGERVQERETITIRDESRNTRRVEGDDEVVVDEEYDEVVNTPKRKSKSGSYRTVDPSQYAGGNYPPKDIGGGDRRSSRR